MEHAQLLVRCEEILKSFNPINSSLDAHASAEIGPAEGEYVDPQNVFLKQTFYGCVRYKHALKVAISSFYYNNSSTTSRADYTKYLILAYLAIFRLEELGFQEFAKFVGSQNAEKMHVFLSYLFSEENLVTWMKDEWIKIFDLDYVENELIHTILKFEPEISALCERMSAKAFGVKQVKDPKKTKSGVPVVLSKPPTRPQPFNLTKPRPPKIPEPMKIKQTVVASPLPKNFNDVTLDKIEQARREKKKKIYDQTVKKYQNSKVQRFKFHDSKRTKKNNDALLSIREEDEETIRDADGMPYPPNGSSNRIASKPFRANPVPDFSKIPATVKTNTSAILREDALYKRKQFQEAQILKSYEENLRDSTDYFEWQSKMRERDEIMRLKQVEERRIAAANAMEEARIASENSVEYNTKVAREMKLRSAENKQKKKQEVDEAVAKSRELVEGVRAIRETAPKAAKGLIKRQNRLVRKQVKSEQEERRKKKLELDKQEQERRNDLIRQIRALEKVPIKRVSKFDPTSTSGFGLLEEMSLIELKERLAINQIREKTAENEIRAEILRKKRAKEKSLKERMVAIQAARKAAAEVNRQTWARREEQAKRMKEKLQRELETKQFQLMEKLNKTREERKKGIQRLKDEETKLQNKRMFLGVAKEQLESTVHKQFLQGAERKAKTQQVLSLQTAKAAESIIKREKQMRKDLYHAAETEKALKAEKDFAKTEAKAIQAKLSNHALVKQRKQNVSTQRKIEREQLDKYRTYNRYATDMFHGGVPIKVLTRMRKDELDNFFESRTDYAKKTLKWIRNSDTNGEKIEPLPVDHSKIVQEIYDRLNNAE